MIGQRRLIRAIGGTADQHESPVAIAAIDIAMLVDLQPHAGVAKRRGNAVMRTVTGNAGAGDAGDFGWRDHDRCDSNRVGVQQARAFNRAGQQAMITRLLTAIGLAILALTGPASAQTPPAVVTPTTIRAALVGNWQGKLEYRDYQADRWFGIPVKVSIEMMRDGLTLVRHADFDDGPKAGIVTITTIALLDPATSREQAASFRKGRETEVTTATLRLIRTDALDRWTLEESSDGTVDDRPARIRETTKRDGGTMVTLKEVDFLDDTGETWLTRNRTTLTRE